MEREINKKAGFTKTYDRLHEFMRDMRSCHPMSRPRIYQKKTLIKSSNNPSSFNSNDQCNYPPL
jgi:hypothetical protein